MKKDSYTSTLKLDALASEHEKAIATCQSIQARLRDGLANPEQVSGTPRRFIISGDFLQELFTMSRQDVESIKTTIRQANAALKNISENEALLINERKQEERLDKGNKWRSFWLRIGTTAGTIIVALLLLNLAVHIPGVKVPRILAPATINGVPAAAFIEPQRVVVEIALPVQEEQKPEPAKASHPTQQPAKAAPSSSQQ